MTNVKDELFSNSSLVEGREERTASYDFDFEGRDSKGGV